MRESSLSARIRQESNKRQAAVILANHERAEFRRKRREAEDKAARERAREQVGFRNQTRLRDMLQSLDTS